MKHSRLTTGLFATSALASSLSIIMSQPAIAGWGDSSGSEAGCPECSPKPVRRSCPSTYSPTAFQGRTAKAAFYNEWNVPVTVVLYHPSNRRIFSRSTVQPKKNNFLSNSVVVGDDWGVCFENKPTASGTVNNLGKISDYISRESLFMIQNPRSR